MTSTAVKKTVRRPELRPLAPPLPPRLWLPFWLRLKARFRLNLMSQFWPWFNSTAGSCSASILAVVQAPRWLCVFGGASLWLCFSSAPAPRPTPSAAAPQVAGLPPSLLISGRSGLRPFVWGGILPLFSHLACNLNTQNISCLTNRP